MSRLCEKCGQPLPEEARRDPPLPPLDHPNVVTIHDLPADWQVRIVEQKANDKGHFSARRFVLTKGPGDGR